MTDDSWGALVRRFFRILHEKWYLLNYRTPIVDDRTVEDIDAEVKEHLKREKIEENFRELSEEKHVRRSNGSYSLRISKGEKHRTIRGQLTFVADDCDVQVEPFTMSDRDGETVRFVNTMNNFVVVRKPSYLVSVIRETGKTEVGRLVLMINGRRTGHEFSTAGMLPTANVYVNNNILPVGEGTVIQMIQKGGEQVAQTYTSPPVDRIITYEE